MGNWKTVISCLQWFLVLNYLLAEIGKVQCTSAEQDLTLTSSEKKALDKLKYRVEKRLPNDYMKTEIYLINWIRAAEGDPEKAERLLKENLKWRKAYNMDNILKEDFSFMEEEYPMDLDGKDKAGRPILLVRIGDWDVRKSHVLGQHDENYRYSMRAVEYVTQKVRDAQAQGKPVTRFQVIFDMDGFNLVQHACLQCLPPYLKFLNAFQNFYPNMVDNFIFINAPQTMESVMQYIRPTIKPSRRRILKFFGTNQKEWQDFLFKLIPRDQLDQRYGGTRGRGRTSRRGVSE